MNELIKSIQLSIRFMFLTFPIMVIRVNAIEKSVIWRWENLATRRTLRVPRSPGGMEPTEL